MTTAIALIFPTPTGLLVPEINILLMEEETPGAFLYNLTKAAVMQGIPITAICSEKTIFRIRINNLNTRVNLHIISSFIVLPLSFFRLQSW